MGMTIIIKILYLLVTGHLVGEIQGRKISICVGDRVSLTEGHHKVIWGRNIESLLKESMRQICRAYKLSNGYH